MRKNMYSLMLNEEVVSAIDKLAAASGTSRSGLINSILAEYVSYRTPEMRIRDMFDLMEQQIRRAGEMQIMLRSSDSLFNLRSMLSYKYNPAVNYSIELYRAAKDNTIGEIRVGMRTQNSRLKVYLLQFYKLWAKIESIYHPAANASVSGERYIRYLALPQGNVTEEELCSCITDYITVFDRALKLYFEHLDDTPAAVYSADRCYREYFQKHSNVL